MPNRKQFQVPFLFYEIYWSTEAGFNLIRGPAGITNKDYYYAANRFVAAEHGGTHIDAPIHFLAGLGATHVVRKRTIGQRRRLVGSGFD